MNREAHPMQTRAEHRQGNESRARSIAQTHSSDLADFIFIGVAVIPLVLAYIGDPAIALLAFCAMLVAGCLGAAYFDSPAWPETHRDEKTHDGAERMQAPRR